jgi:hypothetical protein
MTLDIFFERYLLTLHAIVVAIGLMIYVGVARALPQRRDPSAAIAWVVALAVVERADSFPAASVALTAYVYVVEGVSPVS